MRGVLIGIAMMSALILGIGVTEASSPHKFEVCNVVDEETTVCSVGHLIVKDMTSASGKTHLFVYHLRSCDQIWTHQQLVWEDCHTYQEKLLMEKGEEHVRHIKVVHKAGGRFTCEFRLSLVLVKGTVRHNSEEWLCEEEPELPPPPF